MLCMIIYFIYFLIYRLSELYHSVEAARPGVRFSSTMPPTIGRGGMKGDIYQMVRKRKEVSCCEKSNSW